MLSGCATLSHFKIASIHQKIAANLARFMLSWTHSRIGRSVFDTVANSLLGILEFLTALVHNTQTTYNQILISTGIVLDLTAAQQQSASKLLRAPCEEFDLLSAHIDRFVDSILLFVLK